MRTATKELITTVLVFLFGLVVALSYIVGLYHSYSQHDTADVAASVTFPPWAMYRGMESLWHDGEADWKLRLQGDMMQAARFLIRVDSVGNLEDIRAFATKVKGYPSDKLATLEEGSVTFCRMVSCAQSDVLAALRRVRGEDPPFETPYAIFSPTTRALMDTVATRYGLPEYRTVFDSTAASFNPYEILVIQLEGGFETYYRSAAARFEVNNIAMRRTYKMMFGHEPLGP